MSSAYPLLAEESKIVVGFLGLLNTATCGTGDYVSLKNYQAVDIIVALVPASGTDTAAITVKQATNVTNSASDAKAVAFTTVKYLVGAAAALADFTADDALVTTAVTANSITTSAGALPELFVIHIDAEMLDVAGGFDCVRIDVTDPGSVSTPAVGLYILRHPRYAQATPPTAITN